MDPWVKRLTNSLGFSLSGILFLGIQTSSRSVSGGLRSSAERRCNSTSFNDADKLCDIFGVRGATEARSRSRSESLCVKSTTEAAKLTGGDIEEGDMEGSKKEEGEIEELELDERSTNDGDEGLCDNAPSSSLFRNLGSVLDKKP
mmetsp:Transcript_22070/g.58363  ORF Transcript_22070/g.58363 Transcript_22070/m.58363 type:complete len:145 (+) Transcript_22070:1093-1527(+)